MTITKKMLKETNQRNVQVNMDYYTERELTNFAISGLIGNIKDDCEPDYRVSLTNVKKIDVSIVRPLNSLCTVATMVTGEEIIVNI